MQKINWFPGHMQKALRMMQEEVKNVDALIYVLDGRAPVACLNPEFVSLAKEKPILFVINKIDLADEKKIEKIKQMLKGENNAILELNSTASGAIKSVENALNTLCKKIIEKFKNKGVNYFVRAMVVGVPNSGKSTLVNNLCGNARAITGDKPGVTKGKQWVKLSNNIEILDTPGTLWPNLIDEQNARKLAFIGSIKDEIISSEELSLFLIEELCENYPKEFCNRFGVEIENLSPVEILEAVAVSRKYLIKGGEIDYERTAKAIIDDFRKGRIGRITL
ncbi:MAG: ribosome biogenesis GTPase YlqF [Firmicutes bacterium]|nr:ribosome biogenesis GTPase YlqF [Bacillota bacterium]MDY3658993.1 ribosome biogenesis GTPase YlqF [Eubacteriales bacterium]